jgi:hypothetical protein
MQAGRDDGGSTRHREMVETEQNNKANDRRAIGHR